MMCCGVLALGILGGVADYFLTVGIHEGTHAAAAKALGATNVQVHLLWRGHLISSCTPVCLWDLE